MLPPSSNASGEERIRRRGKRSKGQSKVLSSGISDRAKSIVMPGMSGEEEAPVELTSTKKVMNLLDIVSGRVRDSNYDSTGDASGCSSFSGTSGVLEHSNSDSFNEVPPPRR